MVEIRVEPWKRIIIHEVVEYKVDDFIRAVTVAVPLGGQALPILWTNGVLFSAMPVPSSEVFSEQN